MRPIQYSRADQENAAISAVASDPQAAFVAGGTTLIDLMKLDVMTPAHLVDINALPLSQIEALPAGGVRIGAMVRNSDLAYDDRIRTSYPMLSEALLSGASGQLRNMATVGGNIMQRTRCYYFRDTALPCNKRQPGTGCPAIEGVNRIHAILGTSPHCIATYPGDMSVALVALDAVVHIRGPKGERNVPLNDFYRLPGDTPQIETNLEHGELISHVELPALSFATRSRYIKVRDRASYAFALVSAACALDVSGGIVRNARIALGGVAHKPWRSLEAEKVLIGKPASEASYQAAASAALHGARKYKHNGFKADLARHTIIRALKVVGEMA